MDRMAVEATGEDDAFAVEGQEIELTFDDGSSTRLDCTYPVDGDSWRAIAIGKLTAFAGDRIDVERVVAIVETLEHEETVEPLIAALGADFDSLHRPTRTVEHKSELQSLLRNSSADLCFNKKKTYT